jgi:DNA-binding response OmpR family regulator
LKLSRRRTAARA